MNIFRLAGEIFLIYFLYKLIFEFIIPIFQTTKHVKKQFGDMQNKMKEQMNSMNQQQAAPKYPQSQPGKPVQKSDEYIDYEEVKK